MPSPTSSSVVFLLLTLAAGRPAVAQKTPVERLDSLFAPYAFPTSPGCAVAATMPGMPKLEKAYGMADLERAVPISTGTIFEAGSVSKQVTAAAVVLLAQRGKLSLDADVRKYLPEVPRFGGRKITLGQMLSHTSGLRDWGVVAALQGWPRGSRGYTNEHVLDIVTHQEGLNFAPGDEWMYSNTNYNLAAIVVERVSGESLAEFTRREFFEPLGMRHTSWRDNYSRIVPGRALAYDLAADTLRTAMPNEDAYGNGGLLTTVEDLLIWNDELDSGKVGGRALVDALQRETVLNDGKPAGYGQGLFLGSWRGEREVWHTGATGGYRAFLARYPARKASVALLCNVGTADPSRLGHGVAAILLGGGPSVAVRATSPEAMTGQPGPPRVVVKEPLLDYYAGMYREWGTREPLVVQAGEGVLKVRGVTLEPVSPTEFRPPVGDVRLVFLPAADARGDGRPRALRIVASDTTLFEPVAPADLERLGDYAGVWYSREAEAGFVVELDSAQLVARQRPDSRWVLRPIYADAFLGPLQSIWVFDRNARGEVVGLGIWAARARNNRLTRDR
ncbi:MAG TPA: serine hydrolase domain-containing protein [Longimicrobiales bacterium]